jgi:hypothetical protein
MFLRGRDGEVRIGSGEGCANWPSTKARLKFVGASFTWNMGAGPAKQRTSIAPPTDLADLQPHVPTPVHRSAPLPGIEKARLKLECGRRIVQPFWECATS